MTKARLHPSLLEFKGAMGDMVFKKRGKKTYVSIKSTGSTADPSEAQVAQRKYFKKAVNYVKTVLADEGARAFYEDLAQKRETTLRAVCMCDFLSMPTMDDLDLSKYQGKVGDKILITTYDKVGVSTVDVSLKKMDGTTIEQGQAVEQGDGSGNWEYVATVPVPAGTDIFIKAEAYDRPGHRTVVSANPTVGMNH
jgi:hypothetical protein